MISTGTTGKHKRGKVNLVCLATTYVLKLHIKVKTEEGYKQNIKGTVGREFCFNVDCGGIV